MTLLRSPREGERCAWCEHDMTDQITCLSTEARDDSVGYCTYNCLSAWTLARRRADQARKERVAE